MARGGYLPLATSTLVNTCYIHFTIIRLARIGSESVTHEADYRDKTSCAGLKLDFNPFLPPKHYKYGVRFSLLVGYNI